MKWLLHNTIGNPWFYVMVAAVLWLSVKKKATQISVGGIVKAYQSLFADNRQLKWLMIVIPICLAIATNITKLVDNAVLEIITIVLSILTSMLFTVLTIVDNRMQVAEQGKDYTRSVRVKSVGNETLIIINYEILLSVSLLIACFLAPMWRENSQAWFSCEIFFINGFVIISFFVYSKLS